MHSTQQSFFKNHPSKFRVVLLVQIGERRQDAMRLCGQSDVRGLERLGQLRSLLLGVGNESAVREDLNLILARERNAGVLPLRDRWRPDADGTRRLRLRPKMFNDLFVGHAPIVRHI